MKLKAHQRIIREQMAVQEMHNLFGKWWEKIDIAKNNAIVKEIKRLTDLSFDDWYRLMEDLNPILKWNRKCKIKRDGGAISFLKRIEEIL